MPPAKITIARNAVEAKHGPHHLEARRTLVCGHVQCAVVQCSQFFVCPGCGRCKTCCPNYPQRCIG